jgi:hypothetical protein
VDEPYIFCMSLEWLRNSLTKPHFSYYSREDGKIITNIIATPIINDIEIIEA